MINDSRGWEFSLGEKQMDKIMTLNTGAGQLRPPVPVYLLLLYKMAANITELHIPLIALKYKSHG